MPASLPTFARAVAPAARFVGSRTLGRMMTSGEPAHRGFMLGDDDFRSAGENSFTQQERQERVFVNDPSHERTPSVGKTGGAISMPQSLKLREKVGARVRG